VATAGGVENYGYDAVGNRLSGPGPKDTKYQYNAGNQMTAGRVLSYLYDANGNQTSRVSVRSPEKTWVSTWDYENRLVKMEKVKGAEKQTVSFTYDPLGRRVEKKLTTVKGGITKTSVWSYVYDGDNIALEVYADAEGSVTKTFYTHGASVDEHLALERASGFRGHHTKLQAATAGGVENYGYDAVGNRLSGPGPKDTKYQYNAGNQMTAGRVLSYLYDANGNQTSRVSVRSPEKTWVSTWDYENRLVKMEKVKGAEKQTVSFTYDPLGRRVEKKLTTVKGGITKTSVWSYVYDGDNIALEVYADAEGSVTKTFYTHGASVDEHLALERGNGSYYYHADGLGSVTAITDGNKAVVQGYDYDSFGNMKQSTSFVNSFTYTGREWDKETGLYYYRARYYDPMEGRFISKDPISFSGGDVNLYGYVENNPVNFTDPLGLSPLGAVKKALRKVYDKLGGKLPKGKPGKFGSPQCGTPKKGYRLDPAHPEAEPGSPESGPHINWWDYTDGKRGSGGISGAEPIIGGLLGLVGSMLDPFDAISGELAGPEDDML